MTFDQIVDRLKALANPDNVAGMARYGIATEGCLGSARWIAADAIRELTDEKSWYRWQKRGKKEK